MALSPLPTSLQSTTHSFGVVAGHLQPLVDNSFQKLRPEDLCQVLVVEKILRRFYPPQAGLLIDACSGHDDMDMGMEIQISGLGVQNGGKSCRTLQLLVVLGKGLEDILHTGEHQGIDDLLISPGKLTQLLWQGKGDQVIAGR